MLRVLYISDYADIGGGESSLLEIIHHLTQTHKIQPVLLIPADGNLHQRASQLGIETIISKFSIWPLAWIKWIPLFWLPAIFKIVQIIKKKKIDLIHTNNYGHGLVNSFFPARWLKVPLVWTCHGQWEKPFGRRASVINHFVEKIFFVSDYVKNQATFPAEKMQTVYLGVDTTQIRTGKPELIRQELGLNRQEKIIGMIGRFQEIKNQELFINAAIELLDCGNDLYFLLVGDVAFSRKNETYKLKILNMIKTCPYSTRIKLLNFRHDIYNIFAALDILVIPSIAESFSMVTIEGMACGLNVIATNRGGPAEIIEDGLSGFLFESSNLADLVKKIHYALTQPPFNKNAVKRAEHFDIKVIAEKIYSIYKELL